MLGATAPTKVTVYEYDKLGQLKLVKINNADRYAYRYDASGNIVNIGYIDEKGDYYPTNYTYGNANWRDQLTNFNGEAITYDEIGNPLVYRGAKLSWSNGRQLAKYQKGSMIAEYKYDGNGNRISKSHNGNTYEFIYNGSNLVAMTNTGTTLFNWICDENGDYLGFTYCGVEYYYIRNLQNDVIGIKNPSGTVVVKYEYDPFGKVIATKGDLADTLGKLNPIRYRGYFYDTETGFYFLQSRYYDPETCRFINADGAVAGVGGDTRGYNQFAYCFNNPVNMEDPNGNWPKWVEKVKNAVCLVLSTLILTPIVRGSKDVKKTHVKEEIPIVDGGVIFGGVSLTITTTEEDVEPGLFYKFDDDGNDSFSSGFGVNNNKRSEVGYSDEGNVFSNTQILPFVHVGASLGIDGVGGLIGLDIGNTAIDLEGKVGWGTLLLFPAVVTVLFLSNSGEGNRTPVRQY